MDVGLTAVHSVVEVKKMDTFAQQKTGNLTEKVLRRSRQRRWKEGAFFQSIASMKERTVQKSAQTCHCGYFYPEYGTYKCSHFYFICEDSQVLCPLPVLKIDTSFTLEFLIICRQILTFFFQLCMNTDQD